MKVKTQPVTSPFRRWGSSSSSLKSRVGRVHSQRHPRRPNSLAASDHDMYTKCGDGDDQSTCESETQGSGANRGGVSSWSAAFERLLEDTSGLHTFAEFLKKEFSAENIYFWTACERYRLLTNPTERAKEAQSIFTRHLGSGATEPVNVDSHARQLAQDNLHAAEKDLFLLAQKQIFNLMKFDSYPRFLRSDLHKQCVEAENSKKPLPFPGDKLDEGLKTGSTISTPKLKKSLSNAEDRRRKSLLPWHRKARCKSKDRGEQEYRGGQQSGNKGIAANQGGLSVSKSLDVHSSRSSLASWDAALSVQSVTSSGPTTEDTTIPSICTLCRVFLSDGATTVMQTKPQDTVRQLIEKLLDKRGLTYLAYEVYIVGTNNKSVDVQEASTILAGREVIVEQRVMFKLDLPNRKVISVRSKVNKILGEVLRPILHKYKYGLDLVQVLLNPESTENLDMSLSVLAVDGQRLSIQCRAADAGWKGEVTQISTTNPLAVTAKIRNNSAQVTVPVPSLDEITNRVFEDILQVKAESHNQPEKISDQSSVKSEDYGSETSSGIFGRILRRDSNAPPRVRKPKKGVVAPVPASSIPKPVTGSTEEISDGSRKPLIAKWKAGVKLQVTGRSESDELLESLKRAQRARLEDQRGTEINFELPDFLKDKENYQGVAKFRKMKRNGESQPILPSEASQRICDENLNVTHVSHSNLPTPSIRISPGVTKPNPAPRLSIGQTQSPNKYNPVKEITKVHEMEKNLGKLNLNNSLQSPVKSGFNSLETTVIENCVADSTIICNHIDNLNQSFSSNDSKHEDRIVKHDRNNSTSSSDVFNNDILNSSFKSTSSENDRQKNCSDPPPLPPKPKILPIKPSNWGHNLNTNDNVFNLSQERIRSPNISASSDNLVSRSAYLDQPSSSFV